MELTQEQKQALYSIWYMIAEDIGEGVYTKSEVAEYVIASGRPSYFFPELDWDEFNSLSYSHKIQLASDVFDYDQYFV